jgi:hypothetical protein
MINGTTHMNDLMVGAARPRTCGAVHLVVAGMATPAAHAENGATWSYKPVSPVFTTDRLIPRPPERSP